MDGDEHRGDGGNGEEEAGKAKERQARQWQGRRSRRSEAQIRVPSFLLRDAPLPVVICTSSPKLPSSVRLHSRRGAEQRRL